MPVELPNGTYVEQAPYRTMELLRGAQLATELPAEGRALVRTTFLGRNVVRFLPGGV